MPRKPAAVDLHPRPDPLAGVALAVVFLWFVAGGIAHFALTELEMRVVPPWVPGPARLAVLGSGVLELLGAAGLLWRRTRVAAGWGLVLLTLAVTPANVFMLQHADRFPGVPVWALWARLPLQVLLLAAILKASGAAFRRQ